MSGANAHVRLIDENGERVMEEHAAVTDVGEGDLAVAYWAQHFNDAATVVRVLDSDQIPILQLRAHLANRKRPLYVWLVTPKRPEDLEYHGYTPMPFEDFTLVDVLCLNEEVTASGLRVEEFVFKSSVRRTSWTKSYPTSACNRRSRRSKKTLREPYASRRPPRSATRKPSRKVSGAPRCTLSGRGRRYGRTETSS